MPHRRLSLSLSPHVWLILSLLVPLYYGLISLAYASSQPYIIQDDARLHIVWLQQFVDRELFPQDPIAHYYQTIQAVGFKSFYWLLAKLGIEPLILAKLLPTVLALIATGYLFRLTLHLLPAPACGFWTTLLLNQNIWLKDDLISATPRAFIYPLFTAFLYYLVRRSFWRCLIAIGTMGLFYPQLLLVELGILTLRLFPQILQNSSKSGDSGSSNSAISLHPPKLGDLGGSHPALRLWLAAVAVAAIVILPFQQSVSDEFGAIATAAQMQQMPEFGLNGRREYFGVAPLRFWLQGASGLRLPLFPPILWVSLALPLLLSKRAFRRANLQILPQTLLASLTAFLLAHLLFPRLYLPSRYTFYSFRVVMAVAAGMVLFAAISAGWRWWRHRSPSLRTNLLAALAGILVAAIVVVPAVPALFLPVQGWVIGKQTSTYEFLARQPKDTLIASLTPETDNLPAFTFRSVLVSRELALAYHPAFYQLMQQRAIDLLRAQYSSDLAETRAVIRQYGIDFWLLDRQFANARYLSQQDWLIHSSFQHVVFDTIAHLQQGNIPALTQMIDRCTAHSENNLIILRAACISELQ